MDQKFKTMTKKWHRLHVSRKGFEEYIENIQERLIKATNNSIGNRITNRKQQKLRNRNGKEDNCMDISRDKLTKLRTRRHKDGDEREILRKK